MTTGFVESKINEIQQRIVKNERDLDKGIIRYGEEKEKSAHPLIMEEAYENSISDNYSRSSAAIQGSSYETSFINARNEEA